ncbi:MAG: tetratricopeptide repeat protein [Bacteroidia bacterium]|nr:tetratricopeptide repeat protein [Bacteroidia bacterium]
MRSLSLVLLISLTFLMACVRPQEGLRKKIEAAESLLRLDSVPVPDYGKADSLVVLYLSYADAYQDDTLSPSYLFKAGELSVATGQFDRAIELFGRVQRYPNYNKIASALFLQGFVSDNHKRDTVMARQYYTRFLDQYPKHELADDARVLLQQLSLSPEALIELFEKQNAGMISDSVAGQ